MSTKQNATCEGLVERIKVLEETLAEYKDNAENKHSTVKKTENHQVIPAFTVVIDGAGRLVDMNSTMLNALGYTLDEVLGEDYLTKIVPAPER
jgi:PAS domain-containing protein